MYGGMELVFIGLGFVATVATALWLRPTWAVWMAGNWILAVSTGFVLSVPRYSLPMFGIMVFAAMIADRWRVAGWILAAGSAAAMALLHLAVRLRPMGVLSRATKCPEGTAAIVEVISDQPAAPSGRPDDRRSLRAKASRVLHELASI